MTKQQKIERLARFMGWKECANDGGSWHLADRYCDGPHGKCYKSPECFVSEDFDPYTRLDDAFMVAEKCIGDEGGPSFKMEIYKRRSAPGRVWAHFINGSEGQSGYANTPAEAIALAADAYLDATGFETEHEKGKP